MEKPSNRRRATRVAAAVAGAGLVAAAALAGPALVSAAGSLFMTGNDTATIGAYEVYDPAATAQVTGGVAIEGSEEEQLQQERIAGGAVGAVSSRNLEPVHGVVDSAHDAYVPEFGFYFQAPELDLAAEGVLEAMPLNHRDADLTPADCAACHTAPASGE